MITKIKFLRCTLKSKLLVVNSIKLKMRLSKLIVMQMKIKNCALIMVLKASKASKNSCQKHLRILHAGCIPNVLYRDMYY